MNKQTMQKRTTDKHDRIHFLLQNTASDNSSRVRHKSKVHCEHHILIKTNWDQRITNHVI
jgi:hypothetical protein